MGEARHSAYIVVHGPGHDGTTHVLREGITTFGRLPSNDLILLGDLVSRNHARITFFEGRATLQDLGSHNGCYVNKDRVTTKVLRHGDVCRVGNFQVFFHVGLPAGGAQQENTTASEQTESRAQLPDLRRSESVLLDEIQAARTTNDPATRALRFVLRAADALASARDLPTYMDELLQLALEQTGASLGVYLEGGVHDEARVVVARSPQGPVERPHVLTSVVRWVVTKAFAVKTDDVGRDVRFEDSPSRVAGQLAVLCVPLGDEHQTLGALYLSRPAPGFTAAEQDALTAVAYLAVRGVGRWSRGGGSQAALGRLFSDAAAAAVGRRLKDAEGGLTRAEGTVLRAGLLGAPVAASQTRDPAEHTAFYDAFVEASLSVLAPAGAVVSFGIGAEVCATFLAEPGARGAAPERAVAAALDLRDAVDALVDRHPELAGCRLRGGLDHGRLLLGPMGGPHRVTFGVLGDPVEVAGRLSTAAPAGTLLITEALRPALGVRYRLRARGDQRLRGRPEPVVIHEVVSAE